MMRTRTITSLLVIITFNTDWRLVIASDSLATSTSIAERAWNNDNTTLSHQHEYPQIIPQHIPVEPFISNWCAKQFHDQLGNNPEIEMPNLPIEPYLGSWCFGQFVVDLDRLNQQDTVASLYMHHEVSVEDFLQQWGDDAVSAGGEGSKVEKYIGEWCGAEMAARGVSFDPLIRLKSNILPIEPYVGVWCFESFPQKLAMQLDQPTAIIDLYENHETVEADLMVWYFTNQQNNNSQNNNNESTQLSIVIIILLIAGGVMCSAGALFTAVGYCLRSRQLQEKQVVSIYFDHDEDDVENEEKEELTEGATEGTTERNNVQEPIV